MRQQDMRQQDMRQQDMRQQDMRQKDMRPAATLIVGVTMALFTAAPSQAGQIHRYKHHAVVAYAAPAPHRVCGWVGPAAPPRAVYACHD
jgi:hypothetical protein